MVRFAKIVIIGALGFAVQTIIFELFAIWSHTVSPSTATVLGGEFGLLTNFFLNERFSFKDRAHGHKGLRLARFHLLVAGSIFIQWVVLFAVEHLTSDILSLHIAYVAGLGLGFISNYIGYHVFIWKHLNVEKEKLPA